MKNNIALFVLLLLSVAVRSQEVVTDLQFNPRLYYQYENRQNPSAKRMLENNAFIFAADTLTLPFIDDFSNYHLKSYDPPESFPVTFTFLRSIELADTVREFITVSNTTYTYYRDTITQAIDSFPNPQIQLILNNDLSNNSISTDTILGWLPYSIFDTSGNSADTVFLDADTLLYSKFYVVRDINARWLDNYVFINDDYPVNKLSYGVATFDGLNQYGLPYNEDLPNAYGSADTLTSKPINLLGLDNENAYLSFSYQPQGLGNRPEEIDSLVLEFKLIGNNWEEQWSTPGSDSVIFDIVFKNVLIPITNPFFFSEDFQFRFRNKATISGNNDHWHLDYVYLDRNRSDADTIIRDISVLNRATSFLKKYTSMPWSHFAGFESKETESNITLTFRNNNETVQPVNDIGYMAVETTHRDTIFQFPPGRAFNLGARSNLSDSEFFLTSDFIPYSPTNPDSVVIDVVTSFSENPNLTITLENNVVSSPVVFHNYFAYDDGTAERAYGLEPSGLLKFALEFNLNHPDTLRAIEFHFSQVIRNLSNFNFTLMVWSVIDSNGTGIVEDTLYARPNTPFLYDPVRNGFVTYLLDTPILIQDKFYVGWQQVFGENIQLGLDLNNSARSRMFYYASGTWRRSQVEGAVMIRPVVGKELPITGIAPPTATLLRNELHVYPNPAGDFIYFDFELPVERMEVYDMQGRLLKSITNPQRQLDIADLKNGLYLLRVAGKHQTLSKKFVKQ